MILLKRFFRRIIKDFQHKELLPLKLIFFVQASTLYVLYPYLTIHMRELGINVEETAIMSAVTPFVAIIMPPLAGLVADRIGNFKILLSLFSSFGGAAALLLLLVPVGRVTVQFPQRVVMDLSCPDNELIYSISQDPHPCVLKTQPKIATKIEACGYICQVDLQENVTDQESLLLARSFTMEHFDLDQNLNTTYMYNTSAKDFLQTKFSENDDLREHRQLRNNEFYKSSVRRISKTSYFFPTNQLYQFHCNMEKPTNTEISINASDSLVGSQLSCEFGPFLDNPTTVSDYPEEMTKLRNIESNYIDRLEKKRRFLVEQIAPMNSDIFSGVRCTETSDSSKVSVNVPLVNWTASSEPYRSLHIDNCAKRCILTAPRDDICTNKDTIVEYNIQLTFWLYLVIRVFIGIIGGTAFAMFEGAVIAILREQKADYGLQRIYGSIGGMISSPLSGMLIDYASEGKLYTDFRPAFYLYAALKIASGVLMLSINLQFKAPATNVLSDVVSVLKNVEIVALLLACFVLGTAWGYIESFLFWLLQDLGGSRSLMGITITVGGIAGIPLLVLSGPIINKIGHANVLFIGFVFYAVRLLGYSLIYNPWLCLIFEALESVTASLSFTAAVTYAAKLSTTTTDTSIQGLLGGLYYGVGKGSGSLIGGYLMKAFGTRPTYRIFAVMTLVTGIIYFFFNLLYLKKRPQVEGNDIVKKKPKKVINVEQNNLEGLAERNEKKKIEAGAGDINLKANIDDKEAINNAKNLDGIEKLPDVDEDSTSKKMRKKKDKATNLNEGKYNQGFEDTDENKGVPDVVGKCRVTVERQPDDNISQRL